MSQTVTTPAPPCDEIITDGHLLSIKQKMMHRLGINSMLNSVSRMATFTAGVMIPLALGFIAPALKGVSSISGAFTAIGASELGAVFLGVAMAATAIAIGTDYAASRIWQSGQFDNLEINAAQTGVHIMQEMKKNGLCLAPQENHSQCRADGQKWAGDIIKPAAQKSVQTAAR